MGTTRRSRAAAASTGTSTSARAASGSTVPAAAERRAIRGSADSDRNGEDEGAGEAGAIVADPLDVKNLATLRRLARVVGLATDST